MTELAELKERLLAAESVLALTGAGISVASGLPVYRGAAGSRYDDPETLRYAFASTLRADPAGFWQRFAQWRAELASSSPNAAHEALVAIERRAPRFLLATQNVDGLHRRAGTRNLVELHGDAFRERCLDADCPESAWTAREETRCPRCGGLSRPDVVLFGEGDEKRWEPIHDFLRAPVALVLIVGTSGVVGVPTQLVGLARERSPGAFVVSINVAPLDGELAGLVDGQVIAPAERALPALV